MKIKILHRYIFLELIPPFFVGLLFFTFIFMLFAIIRLIDTVIIKKVALFTALKLFAYLLPSTLAIVFPMAVLVAILVGYGRLSSDEEITAMRASGINFIHIFLPGIIFGLIVSIGGAIFNDTILPAGNYGFRQLYKKIVETKPVVELEEGTLTSIGNRAIGIDKIDRKTGKLYGIVIYERKWATREVTTILAKEGKFGGVKEKNYPDGKTVRVMTLLLKNGTIQKAEKKDEFHFIKFKKMKINIKEEFKFSGIVMKSAREKTTKEIKEEIKAKELKTGKREHRLRVEYHKRFSIPFASVILVIFALPFALVSRRSGKTIALGISGVIIIVYYIFYAMGEGMGREGKLNEAFAVWLPNIIFLIAGIVGLYKITRK